MRLTHPRRAKTLALARGIFKNNMANFDYTYFSASVETIIADTYFLRRAGNVEDLAKIRKNNDLILPPTNGGSFVRGSFFRVFQDLFIRRITSADSKKANEAEKWYRENMRHHSGRPPILITYYAPPTRKII
jgi:hypothetical protein